MRPRSVLYVILLLLLAVFVLANWKIVAAPTEVNLLFTTVRAPGAIIGLSILSIVLLMDWSLHALNRLAWERERRHLTQEMERLRAEVLAAEGSRLHTLQEELKSQFALIINRLDRLQQPQDRSPGAHLPA
jgi:uncharacterized integral membrane protein